MHLKRRWLLGALGALGAMSIERLAWGTSTTPAARLHTGPWSKTVRGLRARLSIERGHEVVGTPILQAYLELENVSDVANTMIVPLDMDTITWKVLDAKGAPHPSYTGPFSGLSVSVGELRMPHDSNLRFNITRSGAGIKARQAGLLCLRHDAVWAFAPSHARTSRFFLSGRVTIPVSKHRVWHGTLDLPAVELPLRG